MLKPILHKGNVIFSQKNRIYGNLGVITEVLKIEIYIRSH